MPALARKGGRRVQIREDEESEQEVPSNAQRRRPAVSDESEEDNEEPRDEGMEIEGEESLDQAVKKLVRYALACEYQRLPITRTGIREKVQGQAQKQPFKSIFPRAQDALRAKFGMELVELPVKESVTLKGRLKDANKKFKAAKPSTAYILTSILPSEYRTAAIIQPSKVVSQWDEATYIGFYTTVVSVIMLSPDGTISDSKFTSILKKLEADENMPMDKTAVIIKRMVQQNYITRTVEKTADEEIIEWRVGPRGKMEIGTKGVQGLVREVYGQHAPEDLEKRLDRSLGLNKRKVTRGENDEEAEVPETNGGSVPRRVSKRSRRRDAEEEEDEDDE